MFVDSKTHFNIISKRWPPVDAVFLILNGSFIILPSYFYIYWYKKINACNFKRRKQYFILFTFVNKHEITCEENCCVLSIHHALNSELECFNN